MRSRGGGSSRLPPRLRGPPGAPHLVPPARWVVSRRLRAARPGPCRGLSGRGWGWGAASRRREGREADLKVLTGKRERHRPESRRAVKSEELSWRGGAVRGHLSLARVEARLPHRPRVTMAAISSSARASVHEWIAEDACALLRSGVTMNKASGGDGIQVELLQILKDDAMKVLHSICQQIWKSQQWPKDGKR